MRGGGQGLTLDPLSLTSGLALTLEYKLTQINVPFLPFAFSVHIEQGQSCMSGTGKTSWYKVA